MWLVHQGSLSTVQQACAFYPTGQQQRERGTTGRYRCAAGWRAAAECAIDSTGSQGGTRRSGTLLPPP